MKFREELLEAIKEEAEKLALRHHAYHNSIELEYQRTLKRVTPAPPKVLFTPSDWKIDRKFDPFYVHKNKKSIAHSISNKILSLSYSPNVPITREIKKTNGGFRQISVYQIPDAAVSTLFYKILLRKNRHRFSGSSYAYRDDRNAHFAIQDIAVDLKEVPRVFVAEYDFSKFFDSISHEYLFAQFKENGFSISSREEHVIEQFLRLHQKGVPQGTSISLFLANLVCWRLDKQLEKAGLRFARYADDTVIWSSDYSKIAAVVDIMAKFSLETEVAINAEKSKGIRILCRDDMSAELYHRTNHIEFLGYSIGIDKVGIKKNSVLKIKRQINYILYQNLLQPLNGLQLKAVTIPSAGIDENLISALSSIRRYLYGNLSDDYIRRYLAGSSGRVFYKGVMSYYPLLTDKEQMQELDGWLVNQVWKAVRKRDSLLTKWNYSRSYMFPFNVHRSVFIKVLRSKKFLGKKLYSIPSFVVIYLALQKAVSEDGLQELLANEGY
ncbi:hypothetical protein GGR79_004063 [Xanthomonas arboricola]|uniref:reverse transcriptase domain-containing protein n=1 Tax=Xanthomonas arboricola TaxID=56448 RepID=UPI00142F556B|nr:reverse transcriptase domain-containing protein [Xanthomonas arboricola]NJC32503.1 hypothetical protein [Xanthomonas arboricola]